jgi:stringent starvation protein B
MSPTQPLPPKKEVALALLERSSVYVHLDPRQVDVVVPPKFKRQAQLVLQVGLNMAVQIPDLRLDDDGIGCTLSFDRVPFFCVVPWASVFAMVDTDGRGMVWPDDVPAEVARQNQVRAVDGGGQREPPRAAERESKDATSSAPPEQGRDVEEAPKAKRPRKRAVLTAVSDASGHDEAVKPVKAVRSAAERPAPRESPSAAPRPTMLPAPAQRSSAGGSRKKKKELPPYLRVVK